MDIFFADFFVYEIFRNSDSDLACIQKNKATLVAKRFLPQENEIARLNIMREQGVQSSRQFFSAVSLQAFVNYSRN